MHDYKAAKHIKNQINQTQTYYVEFINSPYHSINSPYHSINTPFNCFYSDS